MTLVASTSGAIHEDSPYYQEESSYDPEGKTAPATLRYDLTPLATESPPVERFEPRTGTWPTQPSTSASSATAAIPRSPTASPYSPFVTASSASFYPSTQVHDQWEASPGPALQAPHPRSSALSSLSAPSPRLTESNFSPLSHSDSPSSSHFPISSKPQITPIYTATTHGTTSSNQKNSTMITSSPRRNNIMPLVAPSQPSSYDPFPFSGGTPTSQHPSSFHAQQSYQQPPQSHHPQNHPSSQLHHPHSHLQHYMHNPNLNYSLPALHHHPHQRHSDHYSHHAAQSLPEDWNAHANRIGAKVDMEAESISEGEHGRLASHHQWTGAYPSLGRSELTGPNGSGGLHDWDGRMEMGINAAGHWNGAVWDLQGPNGIYSAEASPSGSLYNNRNSKSTGCEFQALSETSSGSIGGSGPIEMMDGKIPRRKARRKNGEPPRDWLQRRYSCELCLEEPKSFARPSALRIHMVRTLSEPLRPRRPFRQTGILTSILSLPVDSHKREAFVPSLFPSILPSVTNVLPLRSAV